MRHADLGTFGAAVLMMSIAVGCGGAEEPPALAVSRVTIDGCGLADEIATGVSSTEQPDLVLTVAHALSGVGAVTVDGNVAVILTIDARSDLALLRITGETDTEGPSVESLRKSLRTADSGDDAEVRLVRDTIEVVPTIVDAAVDIRHRNLLDDSMMTRAGLVLDVELVGGDSGAPVIGLGQGGLLDSVRCISSGCDQPTGLLFPEQTLASLVAALEHFEQQRLWTQLPAESLRNWAERFGPERFRQRMSALIEQVWSRHQRQLADRRRALL